MELTVAAPLHRRGSSSIWRRGSLAAVLAVAENVLVYVSARALGVSLLMPLTPGEVPALLPIQMVVLLSAIGAAAGTIVYAAVRRFARSPDRKFLMAGLLFLLLSFSGPLSVQAADGPTRVTLLLMHVIAGSTIIASLIWRPGSEVIEPRERCDG